MKRKEVSTGTMWETIAGFVRALQVGQNIYVSGTTATDEQGNAVGDNDAAEQTKYILEKIEHAIIKLKGTREDIVRTRVYVRDLKDWEAVARVHGNFFKNHKPANTLVQAGIVGEEYLVEIEADAIVAAE